MKIVVRVNTDDMDKIEKIANNMAKDIMTIPMGDHIKVYVIDDTGKVEELK